MYKTDIDKGVRTPPQIKFRKKNKWKKKVKNKLKKFRYDRIYKTKMVIKKKIDA